jgi:hypothetical protein
MKITTEQLNTVLAEAFGEIWVVEYYCFEETLGRSYYNNKEEAIEEIKRYNKETTNCYATLCPNKNIK